jgi:hypothetical protein
MKFYGIASANGLESFIPIPFDIEVNRFEVEPKTLSLMALTVNANRQRHSVLYQVNLSKADADEVFKKMEESPFEALIHLKETATEIQIMKSPGAEKSWNLIPDTKLDPFNGK